MDVIEQAREQSRQDLESVHGQVWDIEQLKQDFIVVDYADPYVIVRRRSDNVLGSVHVQKNPRLYFSFDIHDQKG